MYTTPWTEEHKQIIQQHYPVGGADLCVLKLGNSRTREAVLLIAKRLKVRAPDQPPVYKRAPILSTEHIDAEILRTYQKSPARGDINKLCARICRTRHWVNKRANKLGVMIPQSDSKWTNAEIITVELNAHRPPRRIQRELKKAGFSRSIAAIVHKRHQMKMLPPDGIYNAKQLAGLMGVSQNKVLNLIRRGLLRAKPLGRNRPDDIHEIQETWVRDFFITYPGEFDHRKVDKFWFIDLLTNPLQRRRTRDID